MIASNRVGRETIETEHGPSQITFYGCSFIAGEAKYMTAKSRYFLLRQYKMHLAMLLCHYRSDWGAGGDS